MSITIELDLPAPLEKEARAMGLLEPGNLARLIERKVAEVDSRDFFEMARDLRALPGEPMTMDEIQKIVDEVREERAVRETRH